jgi:hypothetical protein
LAALPREPVVAIGKIVVKQSFDVAGNLCFYWQLLISILVAGKIKVCWQLGDQGDQWNGSR